ncbi:MAG: 1-acyl-sn-glycerol-3-phosphate acyltransferase [Synergistaceae bacterium]|nr:1-acyl-sn-glycerol-3-phosphate acyltransferase [Synergistaceae bacterium]
MFFFYHRLSVKWTEPLPKGRSVIIACNHCSNLDPLIVGAAFSRRLRYFAKEELFRPFLFGRIIRTLGAVPVSRNSSAAAAGALKGLLKFLEEGSDVLIFPEGSRSVDGKLLPLEGGVGLIACHSKAPVLPVFVKGSHKAMPRGSVMIKPVKITVTFGNLITFPPETYKEKGAREKVMTALEDALKALESKALEPAQGENGCF